jgi:hypothetical protein
MKVFRKSKDGVPKALEDYLQELYFGNPWFDQNLPSLVYRTVDGSVSGFLGRLPFGMAFRGEPIKAVVGGNFMVDPDLRDSFAGPKLLKSFLGGPQDITYSDTGDRKALRMWARHETRPALAQSFHWLKILKPAQFSAVLLRNKAWINAAGFLGKPFIRLTDFGFKLASKRNVEGHLRELDLDTLWQAINEASKRRSLSVTHSRRTVEWLLEKACQKQQFGSLCSFGVYDDSNELMGWFLYYPNRGNVGQVLQVCTRSDRIGPILGHLFNHAADQGSVALIGRLDPIYAAEFTESYCMFYQRSEYVIVHSKRQDLLNAFHSGDLFLTRFEGEWWSRLQGDDFDDTYIR